MTLLTHDHLPPDAAWAERPWLGLASGETATQRSAAPWLAPLQARVLGDRLFPRWVVGDAHAARLLQLAGTPPTPPSRSAVFHVLARTHALRGAAQRFFERHPRSVGVALGAGLSHPFQWLDQGSNRWIDVDLPEVCRLRQHWLPADGTRRINAQADLAAAGWWPQLDLPTGQRAAPVLLLAEGLLQRLDTAVALRLLWNVGQYAPPGSKLLLDAPAWPLAGRSGATGFALRRVGELAAAHPRLRLDAVHPTLGLRSPLHRLASPLLQVLFGVPMTAVYELGVDA